MNKLEFLKRAEAYTEKRNDDYFFKEYYTKYREYHNVEDSVWLALRRLYDEEVANLLQYQYWGPSL